MVAQNDPKPPQSDLAALLATPEAQKLIADAAALAAAAALAKMTEAAVSPSGGIDDATKALFSNMALMISEMSYQSSGRPKPVAPEVIQRRAEAGKKMDELIRFARKKIREARDDGDRDQLEVWMPRYRVTAKCYFNDVFIEPYRKSGKDVLPTEIEWTGAPNDALSPINSVASEIFDAYRESIGLMAPLKSLKGSHGGVLAQDNRPYWMTPGGLVVVGDAPPNAFVALRGGDAPTGTIDNPGSYDDPNAEYVRVMGTIAPPARRGGFAENARAQLHRSM